MKLLMGNKNHWYDGRFYDKIIAPNQDIAFDVIGDFIDENQRLLDVGCGTGRLSFKLRGLCASIDGIDPSAKNINIANKNLNKKPSENIRFFHSDAEKFIEGNDRQYDIAVLSYVIHEIKEEERVNVLKKLSEKVKKIIIVDYLVPRKPGIINFINEIVEFAAGAEHYRNFKSYVRNYGIKGLANRSNLIITKEIIGVPETSHFAILQKK